MFEDPDCDLDNVPNARWEQPSALVISTVFGFASKNTCLVVRRYPD
jgi:3-oxoacyl-(acyl-carrier-protein) synthase